MTTPLVQLKPCPCGKPAMISASDSAGRRSAHCADEDCYWSIVGFTDEDVADRWNRRAEALAGRGEPVAWWVTGAIETKMANAANGHVFGNFQAAEEWRLGAMFPGRWRTEALYTDSRENGDLLWVIGQARALLGKVRKCDTVNSLSNVEKLIAFMDSRGYKSADKIDAATPSRAGGGEVGELDYVPDVLREYADLQDMVVRSGGTFPVRLNGEFPSAKLREWADLMEKDA